MICAFHTCLLARMYLCLQTQYSQSFCGHSGTRAEQRKIWVPWCACVFPAEVKQGDTLFLFQLSYCKRVLFVVCIVPCFLHFCAFCWWFHCFKCNAEVSPTIPKHEKAVICFREKCISFVSTWIIMLLAMSLTLMSQHYILNKVSLKRNTLKTRLCVNQLTKMWPEETLYFP